MGQRSKSNKYRRRRQRAGLILFSSLVIVVLGALMFVGIDPSQRAATVQTIQAPEIARAPEAVAEPEPEIVQVPDIPYNATEKEAREMLEGVGLELGKVEKEPNDDYDEGGVFLQDPLPAEEVEEGSEVGITLSSGPKEEPKEEKKESGGGGGDDGKIPEPASEELYLSVPKMGLTDNYVANTKDPVAMDNGAIKLPSTGFPWQDNANTYIAAHVLGYSGTGSYMQFAGLPSMTYGDEVFLTDANGTTYKYAVSEILTVAPQDNWVTAPIAGKDMVTLQTCVNPPYYDQRLVVRAERVDVETA
jgi:sortase A